LTDLIGQDVNYAVAVSVYQSYQGRARFRPQPAQRALVEAGALGRKSGRGVYAGDAAPVVPPFLEAGSSPRAIRVGPRPGVFAPLITAALAAGLSVITDASLEPDLVLVDGVTIASGDGRRLCDRQDCDVLLDAARDLTTAKLLGVTASSTHAAHTASGFLSAIGRGAFELPDRPGQLVLRTLAQLANAAADAAVEEVASADDIDIAMVLGANHPEGPLAWAGRTGKSRVAHALTAIAAATQDDIYSPSSWYREGS